MAASAPLTTTTLLHGHSLDVTQISIYGDTIVSASGDHNLRIWSLSKAQELHVCSEHTQAITALDANPKASLVATTSWDGHAKLWSTETGSCQQTYSHHDEWLRHVQWSPNGQKLATCSGDATVHVWEAETGQTLHKLKAHTDWVVRCSYSDQSANQLVSSGWDAQVFVWDLTSGEQVVKLGNFTREAREDHSMDDGGVARYIAHHKYNAHLVSLGYIDGALRTFDVRKPEQPVWESTAHSKAITQLATHNDGRTLISAGADNMIHIYDTEQQKCLYTFTDHSDWVSGLAVTHDGTCASCSGDGMTLVWDLSSGTTMARSRAQGQSICCAATCDDENVYVVTGLQSGDITATTLPSLASSQAAAAASNATGPSKGDWFWKKGGWRMTAGIQLTGRKRRYCVLAGDCIKYFTTADADGVATGLKGAIELNSETIVQRREARLLIVNKDRTWDLQAEAESVAQRWQAEIIAITGNTSDVDVPTSP
eukprot:TRINITY_DN9167_c0_g1_i1.p1 TRINITY_DN9167_c0_g1~~TRINITY_DN9167_c0_g1_i1.p1  ORF type:complete len:483 (+),score=50.03 TRINITY_DN9167_c0_g1_i1:306-1754(+)